MRCATAGCTREARPHSICCKECREAALQKAYAASVPDKVLVKRFGKEKGQRR